jgi:hypothetical protein
MPILPFVLPHVVSKPLRNRLDPPTEIGPNSRAPRSERAIPGGWVPRALRLAAITLTLDARTALACH